MVSDASVWPRPRSGGDAAKRPGLPQLPSSPPAGRPSVGLAALPPDEGVIGAGLDQPTPARAGVTGKATRSSMKFASGGSRARAKNAPARAHPALRTAAHHNTLSLRKPTATGCTGAAIESFASRQARGARLRESWKTRTTQEQPPQAKQTDWAVADANRMTPTAHPTQANASPVKPPKSRAFSSRPTKRGVSHWHSLLQGASPATPTGKEAHIRTRPQRAPLRSAVMRLLNERRTRKEGNEGNIPSGKERPGG